MGLRIKIALLLLLALGLTVAGALWVNRLLVLPQLREAEARGDRLDVHRVALGLGIVRGGLANAAFDYAVWDDAVAFMHDRNSEFLASNFKNNALQNLDIHGAAIVSPELDVVFHYEIDLADGTILATPKLGREELLAPLRSATLPAADAQPAKLEGLRRAATASFLYGVVSIKNSDGAGPAAGWVLFYRFVDPSLRQRIEQAMQIDITATPAAASDPPDSLQRDAADRMYWTLRDDEGTPLFLVTVQMPPSVIDTSTVPRWVQAALACGVVVLAVILLGLEWTVLRPALGMARHLQQVRLNSNYALRLLPRGSDELAVLGRECDSLITYVEAQHAQLEDKSTRDALTGVANRRVFDERLVDFTLIAARRGAPLALLLCDLDAFKAYNDHFGHQAGDEVLRRFGVLLGASDVRRSDVPCRYGGEEFAVLLPDTNAEGAALVAARLHESLGALALPHPANPAAPIVTVCIGIAVMNPDPAAPMEPQTLVAQADQALYAAKRAGRNRTVIYPNL